MQEELDPDVKRGWKWLEANQHQFEKKVFGPPITTCSIKDQKYCSLVQSFLKDDDVLCFTAQTVGDHEKLRHQFDNMGLCVAIRTCTESLALYQAPVTADKLAAMGFEGFAISYLKGPGPVLAMLCAERNLHCSPVSLKPQLPDQYDKTVADGRISSWATQDQDEDQIRRVNCRYGNSSMSVCTPKNKYWTNISNPREVTHRDQPV
ncbi:Structural maintenance of chromosomes protein 5 [Sporothrix eucalyptigena]|uniref:Structural maintenance of chromosomes protein 5 n=1 Tax=Sporothrix eucalyptigena TaxID=1812306 RepID=A0ABP0D561_9PEZI